MFDNRVDYLNTVNKFLVVFFILSIFIINFLLMFKKVRRDGLKYSPHRMILMSLAFGDIYLAVFSLIVKAIVFFDGVHFFRGCDLYKAVEVYLHFFIHFVYGTGLALLSLKLIIAYKVQHPFFDIHRNRILSIPYSMLHWTVGLAVVPALTMIGTTSSTDKNDVHLNCFDKASVHRTIAMHLVSVFLPGALAVTVSTAVLFDSIHYPAKVANSAIPTPEEKIDPSYSVATEPLTYQKLYPQSHTHMLRSRMFCVMSFVFFLCVTPHATYNVMSALYSNVATHSVFYYVFFWISVSRSVVEPLIVIFCDTDED